MRVPIVLAVLALAGCTDLPRDPEGTTERVRSSKVLRVGIIATGSEAPDEPQRRFLTAVANATGSAAQVVPGSTETLLPKIEKGELDIVLGSFAADTPWAERVTIMPPLEESGARKDEPASGAAIRNGENGWGTLVHRHAQVLREGVR